jgi:hypothetical protein
MCKYSLLVLRNLANVYIALRSESQAGRVILLKANSLVSAVSRLVLVAHSHDTAVSSVCSPSITKSPTQ